VGALSFANFPRSGRRASGDLRPSDPGAGLGQGDDQNLAVVVYLSQAKSRPDYISRITNIQAFCRSPATSVSVITSSSLLMARLWRRRFGSESEVIRAALRLMEREEAEEHAKLEALRGAVEKRH
jgi:hypothetical protein